MDMVIWTIIFQDPEC